MRVMGILAPMAALVIVIGVGSAQEKKTAGPKEGFAQWEYPGARQMRKTVTGELQTALYTTGDDLAKVLKHYSEKLGRDMSADNFPTGGNGKAGSDQQTQSSTDSFQPPDENAKKYPPRAVTMHIGVQNTKAYTVTVVISRVNGEAHT